MEIKNKIGKNLEAEALSLNVFLHLKIRLLLTYKHEISEIYMKHVNMKY